MNKIICIVMGGVVQNIYSSEETEMEIEIIDLDNENLTDKELTEQTKNFNLVY